MTKERCVKRSFQDSLEDIKERMKEKRTKKLAKVANVNKALSTKVKISNSSATVKSFQANNKALALALEAEKCKSRQAQDLNLHLKRELQRLMFEIFMLRRKLNMQQGDNSSTEKLASLKEIISKVTQNLLETANLLGPAHDLCFSDGNLARTSGPVEAKRSTSLFEATEPLVQMCEPASDALRNFNEVLETGSVPSRGLRQEESSENMTTGNRLSKAWKSTSSQLISDVEKSELVSERENSLFKNVSIRRHARSLNICIEQSSVGKSLEQDQNLHSRCDVFEEIVPDECCNKSSNEEVRDVNPDQSLSKEFILFAKSGQISSSTPEPQPKQSQPLKCKTESRAGREKVRKGKVDGQANVQLKKPWEKSKPRARSKSRERGASKPTVSKDKMNSSLNSGDAYDFACEESIHITPFRQTKLGSDPKENEEPVKDQSTPSNSSSSDEELNDSLYVPTKSKAKKSNMEKNMTSLPLRPRSKRNKTLKQQCDHRTESKSSEQIKPDVARGKKSRSVLRGSLETGSKSSVADEHTEGSQQEVVMPKCGKIQGSKLNVQERAAHDDLLHSAGRNICDFEGSAAAHRIGLSEVTNLCASSRNTESKKHSFPFSDGNRKISEGSMRKRRCTVVVNYAEPSLSRKLRRGDPFTNTEFLLSPIFKNGNQNRKSMNRKSLARYNEAFVGCR